MSVLKAVALYRYARAALSSLIGFGFLAAGLFQARGAGRIADVAWFLVLFVFCQFFAFLAYRRTKRMLEEQSFDDLRKKAEARLAKKKAATGPVLGKTCAACERRIVVESDGCRCDECAAALHQDCKAAHVASEHAQSAYR